MSQQNFVAYWESSKQSFNVTEDRRVLKFLEEKKIISFEKKFSEFVGHQLLKLSDEPLIIGFWILAKIWRSLVFEASRRIEDQEFLKRRKEM